MTNTEKKFQLALLDFDKEKAETLLKDLSKQENSELKIGSLIENTLREIGELWSKGELALSQIYMAGKICEDIINNILPERKPQNTNLKIAIVTLNDFHLLGKKIVSSIVKSAGFNLINYGHGVKEHKLVNKVISDKIEILLISTLMLHSALSIKNVVDLFEERKYKIKILVGGAPFNFDENLWQQVGANAMGKTPSDAITILKRWTKEAKNEK